MAPIIFSWGWFTLRSYGLLVSTGLMTGILITLYLAKKEKFDLNHILDMSLLTILASIVGARIFYVIQFWSSYASNWWKVFAIWEGGLVFFGGLILGLLSLVVYMKIFKLPYWKVLDMAAPGTILGYGIGRIGCFLNGCCEGAICNLPWAVRFPEIEGLRHPTQLYATFAAVLIFSFLAWYWKRRRFDGEVFLFSIVLYSLYRFINEIFRVNPIYFGFSAAQWLSILFGFAAMITWLMRRPKKI